MEQKPECCCKFPTDRMIKVFWSGLQPGGLASKFSRAERALRLPGGRYVFGGTANASKGRSCAWRGEKQ